MNARQQDNGDPGDGLAFDSSSQNANAAPPSRGDFGFTNARGVKLQLDLRKVEEVK